ncbi:zinc finger protein 862-like [Haliotis asinina]|uniref:zinc finger protein 862-like n=1 Tax=Haliotis asinina TaxID=109174 RepID=UPI003531974E
MASVPTDSSIQLQPQPQHPEDTTSGLYVGKSVDRKDTLTAHQMSARHISCLSKFEGQQKKNTTDGALSKAFSKVEEKEVERYKKLFNTAFAVVKHGRPYTDYPFLCQIQKKNGLELGNDHIGRDACVDFQNAISAVLMKETENHMQSVRFVSIMSDSSTDSSVIDQEGILLRYVHPVSHEPVTAVASIEKLENARAEGVVQAIKTGVQKCGFDLENTQNNSPKLICVNLDGAAVNMGAKNGVAKQLSDLVDNKVIITHCVAHKLELGVLDGIKHMDYVKKFEDTIKRICKFYSYSPKRRQELQKLACFFQENLIMYTEIKAIRWVSSKLRALKAVCADLHVTVSHMEQVLSTSNKADELGQARAILNELKQVKFVKYIHLMTDVLSVITKTSELFQTKDLLLFEVKEAIDTLYMKLLAMSKEPGENLSKFYSVFDKESALFDGKLKLTGHLPVFGEDKDVHDLLEKVATYILNRFSDLGRPPVSNFQVFDFRTWPFSLQDLSTYGCKEIGTLCDEYSDILTDEERSSIPSEWQTLKVQVSMQRKSHPLAVYTSILQRQEESVKHILVLLNMLVTVSPSTAACERLFSNMNFVKNSFRTRLTQQNLQNQMRIIVSDTQLEDFDPLQAVEFWLQSGHRHITHRKRQRAATVVPTQASTASCSDVTDQESIQPFVDAIVNTLGGEDIARQKLKDMASDSAKQCLIM